MTAAGCGASSGGDGNTALNVMESQESPIPYHKCLRLVTCAVCGCIRKLLLGKRYSLTPETAQQTKARIEEAWLSELNTEPM